MKRWLPLIVFAALAALLAAGIFMNADRGTTSVAIDSPLIGKPAPAFALPRFGDLTNIVDESQLRGAPYLLNVWGSWCAACRDEHPVITRIAESGLIKVVGFNYKDTTDDAQRWLAQFGNPFDLIVVDGDGRAAIDWGIYGAPETFLVDAEGIVRWKYIGPVTEAVVTNEIIPLLASLEKSQ